MPIRVAGHTPTEAPICQTFNRGVPGASNEASPRACYPRGRLSQQAVPGEGSFLHARLSHLTEKEALPCVSSCPLKTLQKKDVIKLQRPVTVKEKKPLN